MLILPREELIFFFMNYYDLILAALVSIGVTIFLSKALRSGKGGIAGRLGLPFVGETFSFLSATNSTKGCYDFVRLRRLWYGKWFKTRLFGKIHVFVPSAEGARTIFANDFLLYNKGYVKSMADAVGKNSLLCVPKESHKRIRRLLSDPFSMNSLSRFVQKLDDMLCERLQKLETEGESFRLLDFNMKSPKSAHHLSSLASEMSRSLSSLNRVTLAPSEFDVAFDAMCNMLMSITDASMLKQIERDCTAVSDAMLSIPLMIPGTKYYHGIKARNRLMKKFEAIIASRRSGEEFSDDFLQSMVHRDSCPAEEKLNDMEIMDNLLTLIVAGQTTTAAAIMWSVKFLSENNQVQDRLREEQLSILRNKPVGALLTLEDLNNMPYGSKVVKETLRMSNVLMWFPRVALDDCIIQGFEIKKGWHVNIDATCIHYDAALYKDPLQFNPSRFDEMQKPYSYIPFGSGPRTCLGMNMAKVTMLVFLHRLTSGYKWTVDNQDPSLEKKAHIPRLRSGCPITLSAFKDGKYTHRT